MVNVRDHRPMLDRILKDHGLNPASLEIVPDVQAWCRSNNIDERNPWRSAKCFYSKEGCHIVMCEILTDSMISSAKTAMELSGFEMRSGHLTPIASILFTSCVTK